MKRRSTTHGFTLIEVLVTLVILSTGIIVILRAFASSVAALGEARDQAMATLLIGNKLCEAEAYLCEHPGQLPPSQSGWSEDARGTLRWQLTVGELSAGHMPSGRDSARGGLSLVSVQVWRDGAGKVHRGQTYLRPAASDDSD